MGKKETEAYTVAEIMTELESLGNEKTAQIYKNRETQLDVYGVKIGDLKKIVKRVKKNHELSLDLYETKNYDAMYLAGLIADEKKITKADLEHWLELSDTYLLSEFTVPWVAAETDFALEAGLDWIEADDELIESAGWCVLTSYMGVTEDADLDMDLLKNLLKRCETSIHDQKNRVRYSMNSYVIGVGTFVMPLHDEAKAAADAIGKVDVYMGKTACNVPHASDYIDNVWKKGYQGRKRKQARC